MRIKEGFLFKMLKKSTHYLRKYKFIDRCYLLYYDYFKLHRKIRFKRVKIRSTVSMCDQQDFVSKYAVVEAGSRQPVVIPEYYQKSSMRVELFKTPDIYLAEYSNVDIIGQTSLIIQNYNCIYDMCADDYENRYDLLTPPFLKLKDKKGIIKYVKTEECFEEAILLCGFCCYNYFHVTFEILSRLLYIDQFEEYRKLPLLVDDYVERIPQFHELLSIINKYDHKVHWIVGNYQYRVKRLVFLSSAMWMPINVLNRQQKTIDFLISKSLVSNIRNGVLQCVEDKSIVKKRKIFLARKSKNNLRLVNQDEVETLFIQYGFEPVCLEEYDLKSQIRMLREAEFIAGTSGAAFTNIVYCNEGTTIICIYPRESSFYMFSTIGELAGIKMLFLDAKGISSGRFASSDEFEIDMGYCEEFLSALDEGVE